MKLSTRPIGERIVLRVLAYLTPQDLELLRRRMPRTSHAIDAELRIRRRLRTRRAQGA